MNLTSGTPVGCDDRKAEPFDLAGGCKTSKITGGTMLQKDDLIVSAIRRSVHRDDHGCIALCHGFGSREACVSRLHGEI